jgi:hypothetical protein
MHGYDPNLFDHKRTLLAAETGCVGPVLSKTREGARAAAA